MSTSPLHTEYVIRLNELEAKQERDMLALGTAIAYALINVRDDDASILVTTLRERMVTLRKTTREQFDTLAELARAASHTRIYAIYN